MKKYTIVEFSYLEDNKGFDVLSVLNKDEDENVCFPCFNGISFFKVGNKYYKLTYPKWNQLTYDHFDEMDDYFGYIPMRGEYNSICEVFGSLHKISKKEYLELMENYPLKKKDMKTNFNWFNN